MKESKEVYFRNAKEQMKNLLNAEETLDLVEMKGCGYGSRHIAKLLGISKSSVNNYYKLWLDSQVAVSPEEQAEGQRLINRALYGTDYKPEDVAFKKSPLDNIPIPEAVYQETKARLAKQKKPRILFIDLETSADIIATFGRFKINIGDITALEAVYNKFVPLNQGTSLAPMMPLDHKHCTSCGSIHVHPTGRTISTSLSMFSEYECNDCGAKMRDRVNTLSKEQRSNLLMPL